MYTAWSRILALAAILPGSGAAFVGMSSVALADDAPPPGFASRDEAIQAIKSGQVAVVNPFIAVPDTVELQKDIQYGTGNGQPLRLDFYRPKQPTGPVPGLVFVHGGGWRSGKRSDYHFYGVKFAEQGYAVATITYRLSDEAPFPAAVQDAKCAVRWMRANAEHLGIDPERMGIVGGSAGGHLALMVAYTADVPELEGEGGHAGVSSRVQAVIDLYGPADLTTPMAGASQLVKTFMGGHDIEEAAQEYRLASPIHHVSPDDPPSLILHGTIDQVVSVTQSDALVAKLESCQVPHRYERLEGWPHAMDIAQEVNRWCRTRMFQFLDTYLRSPAPSAAARES